MMLIFDGFGIEMEMVVECVKCGIKMMVVFMIYYLWFDGLDMNFDLICDGGIIFLELYCCVKINNLFFYFGSVGFVLIVIGFGFVLYVVYEWVVCLIFYEVIVVVFMVGIFFGV